jgi:hypothetical protein
MNGPAFAPGCSLDFPGSDLGSRASRALGRAGNVRAEATMQEMKMKLSKFLAPAIVAGALVGGSAMAQTIVKAGALSCDVSAGVGMILVQKQTLRCAFQPSNGGPPDYYVGRIVEYGAALGAVAAGHLIWGVIAPASGVPQGALAGTYAGAGAEATVGAGLGANVLIGGTGRAFSLQPLSVEGQTGLNVAAGITTVTLEPAR